MGIISYNHLCCKNRYDKIAKLRGARLNFMIRGSMRNDVEKIMFASQLIFRNLKLLLIY